MPILPLFPILYVSEKTLIHSTETNVWDTDHQHMVDRNKMGYCSVTLIRHNGLNSFVLSDWKHQMTTRCETSHITCYKLHTFSAQSVTGEFVFMEV